MLILKHSEVVADRLGKSVGGNGKAGYEDDLRNDRHSDKPLQAD